MRKELFSEMIMKVKDHANMVSGLYDSYGFDLLNSPISEIEGALLKLLREVMEDKDDWIGYWMWELDFGKKWEPGKITSLDGTDIKLETLDDLWNLLTEKN